MKFDRKNILLPSLNNYATRTPFRDIFYSSCFHQHRNKLGILFFHELGKQIRNGAEKHVQPISRIVRVRTHLIKGACAWEQLKTDIPWLYLRLWVRKKKYKKKREWFCHFFFLSTPLPCTPKIHLQESGVNRK